MAGADPRGAAGGHRSGLVTRTDTSTCYVYVLDLGIVVPVALLAGHWLWRRQAWGYLLAGCVLIKAATMGLALLSMVWFTARASFPGDPLAPMYALIAAGGVGMSAWFLRHCRG